MNDRPTIVSRRNYIGASITAGIGALIAWLSYPILRYITPPESQIDAPREIDAGRVDDPRFLKDGFKIVQYGSQPVLVIKVSDTDFRAFSATCTHLGCTVGFRNGPEKKILCNCHGGTFDLTGNNVSGPAPRPLERFRVEIVSTESDGPGRILVGRA